MKVFAILLALLASTSASAEYVEIWAYAFITHGKEEPVAGYSASIFKPDRDGLSGPLYTREQDRYLLNFSVLGDNVTGVLLTPDGTRRVELTGTLKKVSRDGGCGLQIHLQNGTNQVVLERFTSTACAP